MFNYSSDKVHGGLGSRHGEDQSLGGAGHGLGIADPQHHQHQQNQQHQQYPQHQAHASHHQSSLFASDFGFAPSQHDPSSMSDYSASMGHGQAQFQAQGEAMDVEESEPRVTNLIAHFENRSKRPHKSAHNVPGSSTASGRGTNQFRVTSPAAEQFASSSRVRSGSIGRPPPVRFGSMGQQGGLRVASPMASHAGEAHGSRGAGAGSRVPDASAYPFRAIPGPMDMPTPLRRQSSSVGGGMRPGHVGNISANLYSNVDALSSSGGHFDGASSPYGFVNSANRAVRPMHMMDGFGAMGGAPNASPIIGTPASPFANMDFSAPRVISPVQSPPTDPFGDLSHFGSSMGDNPAASPFDAMSPGGRVTSPMQPPSGVCTYGSLGMDTKDNSSFVGSPTDHFQGLDPFQSMNSTHNQHSTHQFGDMSAAVSMETWGDMGVFAKQEPSADTPQFKNIPPAPSSDVHTPVNFGGQSYFQVQPQQQQQQQPQLPPRPAPSNPPARPAKKPFLRQQQNTTGSTPGFNIWKPPVPTKPKPAISNTKHKSTPSTSSQSYAPQSRSGLRLQTENTMSPQPYTADMAVTSPDTIMSPSVASPIQEAPSAASPVRPHEPARPPLSNKLFSETPSPTRATPSGHPAFPRAGTRRGVGIRQGHDPPPVPRGTEAAERSHPGDGGTAQLPGYVCFETPPPTRGY